LWKEVNEMHVRKLVKAGPASHTVSLPKDWLDRNKLSKGSTVYIHEKSDHELLITPHLIQPETTVQRVVTINIDNKPLDTVQREITAAYVNNANTIDIIGETLAKHAESVRNMLHDFVALEIAEQTATRISAKDLLNLEEISVDKSIKRMDIIVRTMLQDAKVTAAGKDMSDSVALRDYDVNRLYFLLTRLLKSSLNSPGMAERLELAPNTVLNRWMLVHHLENLADAIKSACKDAVALNAKERKPVAALLAQLEQDHLDAMKAVHEKNKKLADDVARRRVERQQASSALDPRIAHNCSAISSLLSDIARLVIDEN
jgi:phosphate uptake regulator